MYYSYRQIDSYNTPIRVILSRRGLGKTFGAVMKGVKRFGKSHERFIYVVETQEMIKTLAQNKGEKFFASILDYLKENPSHNNNAVLRLLNGDKTAEIESDDNLLESNKNKAFRNTIQGGTIKINGETAGYIVAFNDFANIKRNNFANVKYIVIDEFIPENIDVRSLQNARKIVSIVQSIARTQDVIIYMLANTIRLDDIVLVKLGLSNMKKGTFKIISDKYGALIAAHYVDNKEYGEFTEKANASVAGRLAAKLGETNLDENTFKTGLPTELELKEPLKPSTLYCCLHGASGSIRIHSSTDHSEYYVFNDYGRNKNYRYCFDKKYISTVVKYYPPMKDLLLHYYQKGIVFFESGLTYTIFCDIFSLAP